MHIRCRSALSIDLYFALLTIMTKLAQMLRDVLDQKASRTLDDEDAKQVMQEYFKAVSNPLEEIGRQKLQAAEENRLIMCR